MVKDWEKYKNKSPYKLELEIITKDIIYNNLSGYEIQKLEGDRNLYRIRKGKIRIIFMKGIKGNIIVKINSRGDVYKGI